MLRSSGAVDDPLATAQPPVADGEFPPNSWLPVLSGRDYSEISKAHDLINGAGIESIAYGGHGFGVIVPAKDFNRSRSILLADPESRERFITKAQFERWMKSR